MYNRFVEIHPHWSFLPAHFQELPRTKSDHRVYSENENEVPVTLLIAIILYCLNYLSYLIAGYGFGRGFRFLRDSHIL